jgi:hypothetical protein
MTMAVYTVHEPPLKRYESSAAPERFAFVRDGFSFWAFVLAPLWMLGHRLWLVLFGYVVLVAGLAVVLEVLHASATVKVVVAVLLALLVGFEAGTLRRFTLGRRGWNNVGIVLGEDRETAEQRFFDAWTMNATARSSTAPSATTRRDTAASSPSTAPSPRRAPAAPDVVGLFPESGASR